MIQHNKWMEVSARFLAMGHKYKSPHTTYSEDYDKWLEDFKKGHPDAIELAEKIKVWEVTQRLKS